MNKEMIFTLLSVKTTKINRLPGGKPEFTSEDAKHVLAHMPQKQFNYCQYVFMLYDEKIDPLVSDVVLKSINSDIKKDTEKVKKLIKLCRIACKEQRKEGRSFDTDIYKNIGISRGEWRYRWKDVYFDAVSYLNDLRSDVYQHIKKRTS